VTQLTDARRRHLDEILEWLADIPPPLTATMPCCRPSTALVRSIWDCVPESVKTRVVASLRDTTLPAIGAAALDAHIAPLRQIVFDVLSRFDILYNQRKDRTRGARLQ